MYRSASETVRVAHVAESAQRRDVDGVGIYGDEFPAELFRVAAPLPAQVERELQDLPGSGPAWAQTARL